MRRLGLVATLAIALTLLCGGLAARAGSLGDVTLKRTSPDRPEDMPIAVFPHWKHRLFFTCNVCHPAIFPMAGGTTAITMEDIGAAKYCGTCHDGKTAWGIGISTCGNCHPWP